MISYAELSATPKSVKDRAHIEVTKAIRSGKLVRQQCEAENCGDIGHAHHDNYYEPLAVRWLCKKHHAELHSYLRPSRIPIHEQKRAELEEMAMAVLSNPNPRFNCMRCKFSWPPRVVDHAPVSCPNCKSRLWNTAPKLKPVTKE